MSEAAPKRRRTTFDFLQNHRLPFWNGKRLRIGAVYPPGTLFVTREEYYELKRLEKEGKKTRYQLDEVAMEMIKLRESKESSAKAVTKPKKPKPSISIKEQRTKIKAFAKEKSEEVVEQFTNEMIPDEIRDSLSEEKLQFKKHELSADLSETMNSRLYWAFYDAWLESQMRHDS